MAIEWNLTLRDKHSETLYTLISEAVYFEWKALIWNLLQPYYIQVSISEVPLYI